MGGLRESWLDWRVAGNNSESVSPEPVVMLSCMLISYSYTFSNTELLMLVNPLFLQ